MWYNNLAFLSNENYISFIVHLLPAHFVLIKERRVQLMRNHTAQHLFAWAVEQVVLSSQSDGSRELQHQGGSVHPDRFVVNTALVDQASTRAVEQDAVGFVRHLENLCRDVIRQRLDVRRVQTKWSSVVKVFTLFLFAPMCHVFVGNNNAPPV
ncbi:hypothetical protein FGIG_01516 [Fasciola gigantica]|uniref:Uncharacterized protein n=1 Tax=Fasciola gigantica TaxID=46835 RepID=A0A504Y781_FASGI|nr:hypothetical protein FGIG_01516 [Fasciola gigantica]